MKRKILSLTLNQLKKISFEEILLMIEDNLQEASKVSDEYAFSIASAIVKRVFLIKDFSREYDKFFKIIFSDKFKNNKYVYNILKKEDLSSLKDLYDLCKDKDLSLLINSIFIDNEKMFNELIVSKKHDVKSVFNSDIVNSFTRDSYKRLLSYLLKGNDKNKVIKALINSKNSKFVYMVSKMDEVILTHTNDDTEYFDAVLTLLNYNDYRKLLWDYYNKFVNNEDNDSKSDNVPYELKLLLNYTFNIMYIIYSTDRVPNIISNMKELDTYFRKGKDMVHIAVFGVDGYKKVKNDTFDIMNDFPKIDEDNKLLNLKIAFFSTIYGLTYVQVGKLIDNYDNFMKDFKGSLKEDDELIRETLIAMKSLYNLTLENKEEINLYREVYYKYIKQNGIYTIVEVDALVIMETLMRRMYDNSIELI